MPNYFDVIDANKFWTAPESDLFSLLIVAIALGIGRNKMNQIPVERILIDKRTYYKKSDILDWFELEQTKGKDSLLLKLRAQNSSIGRAEKLRSKAYDQIPIYGGTGRDERGRPDLQIKRLLSELDKLERCFAYENWPENNDKVATRELAVDTLNILLELKSKCDYFQKNRLKIYQSRWWCISDKQSRDIAHKKFYVDNEREWLAYEVSTNS